MSAPTSTRPHRRLDRLQVAHLVAFATVLALLVLVLAVSTLAVVGGAGAPISGS